MACNATRHSNKLELKSKARYLNIGRYLAPPVSGPAEDVVAYPEEVTRRFVGSTVGLSVTGDERYTQPPAFFGLLPQGRKRHASGLMPIAVSPRIPQRLKSCGGSSHRAEVALR